MQALSDSTLIDRLSDFASSDLLIVEAGEVRLHRAFSKRWLDHLIDEDTGRCTPPSAMAALPHFAELLEFSGAGNTKSLRYMCATYHRNGDPEINRGKGYTNKLLAWLEDMAFGVYTEKLLDRLVCGRLRTAAGAFLCRGRSSNYASHRHAQKSHRQLPNWVSNYDCERIGNYG